MTDLLSVTMQGTLEAALKARETQVKRTIYVGNLHPMTTAETLLEVFQACGEVKVIRMAMLPPGSDPNRGRFGFIEFATLEAANLARDLSGIPLLDRLIKVNGANAPITIPSNATMKGPIVMEYQAPVAAASNGITMNGGISMPSSSGAILPSPTIISTNTVAPPPQIVIPISNTPDSLALWQNRTQAAMFKVGEAVKVIQKTINAERTDKHSSSEDSNNSQNKIEGMEIETNAA